MGMENGRKAAALMKCFLRNEWIGLHSNSVYFILMGFQVIFLPCIWQ